MGACACVLCKDVIYLFYRVKKQKSARTNVISGRPIGGHLMFLVINDDGQRNELAVFFKKNKARLYHIAISKVHNCQSAEDAVIETFAQIADKPDIFFAKPPEQRTAYASGITRNIASKMFAKKCSECSEKIEDHEDKTESTDPEKIFFDNENANELIKKICSLPDGRKAVMTLSILHNKSIAQIAQILDISESAVRKRLSDARKLIRKYIKENDDV